VIHRLELPYGRFERRIELPPGRYEVVQRELIDGCLTLSLRKL
jgi:HSP20 family molecular chaperone IbpA